jgi:hypothetical protein
VISRPEIFVPTFNPMTLDSASSTVMFFGIAIVRSPPFGVWISPIKSRMAVGSDYNGFERQKSREIFEKPKKVQGGKHRIPIFGHRDSASRRGKALF